MSIQELETIPMMVHIAGEPSMTGLRKEEVDGVRNIFLERLKLFKEAGEESKLELPKYMRTGLAWDAMIGVRPKEPYVKGKLKDDVEISLAETDMENVYSMVQGTRKEGNYAQFLLILKEKPGAFWKSKNLARKIWDGFLGLLPDKK